MKKAVNMTKGPIVSALILYALPLMLGNVFQAMYILVDSIIVGRGLGAYGLSALGSADWLVWLPMSALIGLTQGFAIRYSKEFGAQDYRAFNRVAAMTSVLGLLVTVLVTLGMFISVKHILHLIATPQLVFEDTYEYVKIMMAGLPVVYFYNCFASILRSVGNSRDPLTAMVLASVLNVILDYYFIIILHWRVGAAALATVIAQAVSMVYCFFVVMNLDFVDPKRADFKLHLKESVEMLKLGTPMLAMNVMISVGGLIVQTVVNGLGFVIIAANTVVNKMYTLIETAAVSFGFAMTTFTAQNLGAGQKQRIRNGFVKGLILAVITSLLMAAALYLLRVNIVSVFIEAGSDNDTEVIKAASYYLRIIALFLPILYLLYISRCTLQGLQDTLTPMISSVVEFFMRLSAVLVFPSLLGPYGVFYAEISAWIGAMLLLMTVCTWKVVKLK